jgi:hypothetical protein
MTDLSADRESVKAGRYAQFHAGAVAFRQRGILLPGPKRCGKSVLTLGLLLNGALYLSEDVAVLEHRSLQLTSNGQGVSLRLDTISLFPEVIGHLTAIPTDPDGDPYQQIAYTSPDRFGSGFSGPCSVGMIVFPIFAADGPSAQLVPISAGQAVLRLLESCIILGVEVDRGIDVVTAMVETADAYILRYHDARHAVDAILRKARAALDPSPMTDDWQSGRERDRWRRS